MVCRICLKKEQRPLQIFGENAEQYNIADVLNEHFWFQVLPDDPISTVICKTCWDKVNDFHELYEMAKRAHSTLTQISKSEQDTLSKDEQKEFTESGNHEEHAESIIVKVEPTENVLLEEEQEVLQIDENMSETIAENPLCEDKSMLTDDTDAHVNDVNYPVVIKSILSETEETDDIPLIRRITTAKRKKIKREKSLGKKQAAVKRTVPDKSPASDSKRGKRQRITERDDEVIKKHIAMGCDICTFVGNDFSDMTEHFRSQHPGQRAYVICCKRKLTKRFILLQHAYKHEDPDFFKCTDCNKTFSDGYVLRAHISATHAPNEERLYGCDKCEKRFPRRHLLELHKPSHIPVSERQFPCPKCPNSKPFASEHFLQIHTSMRHTRAVNVCHVCAKEIRDKNAFEKHVRLHFESSGPRVKCPRPGCDRWLKDADNLKQHLRRHNDEGKIFTCGECGRICKNRRALTSHLNYAHNNETYECEECNKTFKKAISLKEHMAQHTGQALYKCPFCERTFNSNANMHSHKKKMHPIEWDLWRKTKSGSSQTLIQPI